MPSKQCNGANIYYERHGKGNPLVLISGYTCDHTIWSGMLDSLTKHFEVILFDNRAVGQTTDSGESFTVDQMAEDVMQLCHSLNLDQPTLMGHSLGGAIAQIAASKYQAKISKIILLNTVAHFTTTSQMLMMNLLKMRELNLPLETLLDLVLPLVHSSHFLNDPKNIAVFKELAIANPFPQSLSDQKRQMNALKHFDAREKLAHITVPSLVIAAEEDLLTLPLDSKKLAHGLPHATFNLIPGAHASPVERIKEVNECVIAFV